MKTLKVLFYCHLAALTFGLAGLLIALPHPELWNKSPLGQEVFTFGMNYAGSLHILFGAATMLVFGLLFVGARKTLIFFAASTLISLSMELLGTSTGFPFGPYAYTNFLGMKILGLVPYAIPLSWFYMGFTSLLLANLLVARIGWSRQTLWSLLIGAYLLTVWDISLDPAMANTDLPVHFWIWSESGPYFGMPVSNLVGWSVTGLIYMSVSRFLWHEDLATQRIISWLPLSIYIANTCFAIVLNLSIGLWLPPLISLTLGLLPTTFVLLPRHPRKSGGWKESKGQTIVRTMSHLTIQAGSQFLLKRYTTHSVEGIEQVPTTGPTLIVARHYHHLFDGCALLSSVARRLHILIAPDWIDKCWLRFLMEFACKLVEWPMVLRADRLQSLTHEQRSVYTSSEAPRYLRQAFNDAVHLLRRGEVLVVFPEAYPTVDTSSIHEKGHDNFLPFRTGFAHIAEMAERDRRTRVAIIPTGFSYSEQERWHITLRFGPALFWQDFRDKTQLLQAIEQRVHELSQPSVWPAALTQEALDL